MTAPGLVSCGCEPLRFLDGGLKFVNQYKKRIKK
jgi:hypothetical protein